VNGDGKADVCGRSAAGIQCSLSTGSGFGTASVWIPNYTDGYRWNMGAQVYSTIRFPDLNGDGKADVCGRGSFGLLCALSSGSDFGTATWWTGHYSQGSDPWDIGPEYWSTIRFPDLNGDGMADVCARASGGAYCATSTGAAFGAAATWTTGYSDSDGWNRRPETWSTIRFPDVDGNGKADICGRSGAGISCALSSGSAFAAPTSWSSDYSDADGWNLGAQYYSTIVY
jgi:hypothetical protein